MATTYEVKGITGLEGYEKPVVCVYEEDGSWVAMPYVVSKFGNLSTSLAINRGKTKGAALGAFKRSIAREYEGATVGDVVLDGPMLQTFKPSVECFFCDPNDESVHENFKAWAAGLFE